MTDFVWLNGQYLPRKDTKITLLESGLLYGYGVFETLLIYSWKPFQLGAHYERLKSSAKHIRMPVNISIKSLQTAINRLVQLNHIEHGFVRIAVSSSDEPMKSMKFSSSDYSTGKESPAPRGVSTNAPRGTGGSYQTSMIFIETGPVSPEYKKYRQSGGSIIIYPYRRSSETPYYKHKTLAYMENLLARRWAFKYKAIEAIFINTNNYVMEGTRSTIFIVKDRKVFTPSIESNILRGITRQVAIGLCTKNAIKIREKLLQKEDIFSADEVFLTSSLMEIMPVISCKIKTENNTAEKNIGDQLIGPITRILQNSFEELLQISCK